MARSRGAMTRGDWGKATQELPGPVLGQGWPYPQTPFPKSVLAGAWEKGNRFGLETWPN